MKWLAIIGGGAAILYWATRGPKCCWSYEDVGGYIVRVPKECGGHPCGTQLYG